MPRKGRRRNNAHNEEFKGQIERAVRVSKKAKLISSHGPTFGGAALPVGAVGGSGAAAVEPPRPP
eukprot:1177467-Prorocentrum_minimum.AAC.3